MTDLMLVVPENLTDAANHLSMYIMDTPHGSNTFNRLNYEADGVAYAVSAQNNAIGQEWIDRFFAMTPDATAPEWAAGGLIEMDKVFLAAMHVVPYRPDPEAAEPLPLPPLSDDRILAIVTDNLQGTISALGLARVIAEE